MMMKKVGKQEGVLRGYSMIQGPSASSCPPKKKGHQKRPCLFDSISCPPISNSWSSAIRLTWIEWDFDAYFLFSRLTPIAILTVKHLSSSSSRLFSKPNTQNRPFFMVHYNALRRLYIYILIIIIIIIFDDDFNSYISLPEQEMRPMIRPLNSHT